MSLTVPLEGFGGGGMPLNFKVVKNPQPSNPSENTIWVNTDTPIAAWHFGADEPAISDGEELHVEFVNDDMYATTDGSFVEDANYIQRIYALPTGVKKICVKVENYYATNSALGFMDGNWGVISGGPTKAGTSFYDVPSNATYFSTPVRDGETVTVTNADAKEGTVWFPTGISSDAEFNALKKNGIQICPMSAKQKIGGTWVDKPTEVYQNSEWKPTIGLGVLYENGNENDGLTGGWSARVWKITSAWTGSGTATLTRYADHLTVTYRGSMCSAVAEPMRDIDLTNYSTLEITARSSNDAGRLYITRREGQYVETHMAAAKMDIGDVKQTRNFDISGLSGFYDIAVCVLNGQANQQTQTVEIYSIKLK